MMKRAPWLSYSFLGLSIFFLSACTKPNEINLTLSQSGKVVLHPKPGDVLNWTGVQVHFYGTPLCTDHSPSISTCTVDPTINTSQAGQYFYACASTVCSDPEVDMGSGTLKGGRPLNAKTVVASATVTVPCNGGQIQLDPATLPDAYESGSLTAGNVVQWMSNGTGSSYITDWVVNFDEMNNNVCNESSIGYNSSQFCTIKAAAGTHTYKVTSPSCHGGPPGGVPGTIITQ